jgi:hypothetical protein
VAAALAAAGAGDVAAAAIAVGAVGDSGPRARQQSWQSHAQLASGGPYLAAAGSARARPAAPGLADGREQLQHGLLLQGLLLLLRRAAAAGGRRPDALMPPASGEALLARAGGGLKFATPAAGALSAAMARATLGATWAQT